MLPAGVLVYMITNLHIYILSVNGKVQFNQPKQGKTLVVKTKASTTSNGAPPPVPFVVC